MATERMPTGLIIGLVQLANSEDKDTRRNAKRLLELNAIEFAREIVELRDRIGEAEPEPQP